MPKGKGYPKPKKSKKDLGREPEKQMKVGPMKTKKMKV